MFLLAKYNTQTDFYFPMVKRGVVDLSVTADWTPATGDTKVSKDGGAVANTTNNPAIASGTSWKLTLTASELSAKWITVQIVDAATKAVEDQFLTILTYGNASAFFIAPDFQDAVRFGLTALPNANAEAAGGLYTRGSGAGQINQNANGQVDARAVALSSGVITEAAYDTTAGAFQHLGIVDQGTAQGATGTTLQVRAGAPFADSTQAGATIWAFGSTQGYWQERVATGYVGATKTFTVDAWTVTPSGTITYIVFGTPPNSSVGTVGANVTQWNGTNVAVPATAGVPKVAIEAAGDFAQGAADKVWSSATRTLTAFSTALAVAVWDVLEAAIATASSIGVKLKTNLDATVSSRLASASYTAPLDAAGTRAAVGLAAANLDTQLLPVANLPSAVKKNTALAAFPFVMVDTTGAPTTGLTVSATRSIDGAAFGACANAVVEVANGGYKIDLAAADLNGNTIILRFAAAPVRVIALSRSSRSRDSAVGSRRP
jgi:hypothetical protein